MEYDNLFLTCNNNSKHLFRTEQCFKHILTYSSQQPYELGITTVPNL